MRTRAIAFAAAAAAFAATPASANEIFGGVYAHDVKTGITVSGIEDGVDLQLGWRGDRLRFLSAIGSPSPHVFVQANTAGDTHFAAAGISWKIGRKIYLRPGVGIAVHTGPSQVAFGDDRIDFGSRILFEPEIGIGVRLGERASLEASWVHLSHGKLFSSNNPGVDNIGVRFNLKL